MWVFHKQPPKSLIYLFCYKTRKTTDDDLGLLQKSNFINRNTATKVLCYTIKNAVKMEVLLVDGISPGSI